jgi:hypothetical protein
MVTIFTSYNSSRDEREFNITHWKYMAHGTENMGKSTCSIWLNIWQNVGIIIGINFLKWQKSASALTPNNGAFCDCVMYVKESGEKREGERALFVKAFSLSHALWVEKGMLPFWKVSQVEPEREIPIFDPLKSCSMIWYCLHNVPNFQPNRT